MSDDSATAANLTTSHSELGLRVAYALLLTISLALTTARLMQAQPLMSANDRSRWSTVWSLVERGTFQIDEIRQRPGWDTIDLVRHDGHFYSTKPPILSTLVAGVYWVVKHTLGWTLDDDLPATSRLILMIINVLPFYAVLLLLIDMLERHARESFTRACILATAAWGTLLLSFLVTLNNHTPATVGLIVCLWALGRILDGEQQRGWLYAVAGFSAAVTCCLELPAAALGVMVFAFLCRQSPRHTLLWFVPAAVIPLAAFFGTNVIATGSWKPFYMYYGTEKYVFIHEGVPSYWANPQGLDQAKDGPLAYLLHCTFGHHGVFSLTPVFLLTLWGWLTCARWRGSSLRTLLVLGLMTTLIVFGFYLSKTENYNYGGVSIALRWMLWLIPFWLLTMIPVLDRWRPDRWGRALVVGLLGLSVFSAWYPFEGPWQQPWLFQRMEAGGWIDYSNPAPPPGQPFHAWIHQLPPAASLEPLADYWAQWEGLDTNGNVVRLRLQDSGRTASGGRTIQRIDVIEQTGDLKREWTLDIDRNAFDKGAAVSDVIVWPVELLSADERRRRLVFLHGLPRSRAYVPGRLRYLHTPLQRDAFECRLAASRVLDRPGDALTPAIYRRDLWLSDAVPFGVLRWEATVSDPATGAMLSREVMNITSAGENFTSPSHWEGRTQ